MNAAFNPVDFIHRREAEGIARGAAEAIAQGIEDRNRKLATRADLDGIRTDIGAVRSDIDFVRKDLDRFTTKGDLKLEIQTALARQTVQFGAMLAAGFGLGTAILGVVIALH